MKLNHGVDLSISNMIKHLSSWLPVVVFLGWSGQLAGQEELLPAEQYRREPIERHDLDREMWQEVTRDLNYFDDKDSKSRDEASDRQGPMGNEEEKPPPKDRQVSPWLRQLGSILIKILIIAGAGLFLFLLLKGLLGLELAPRNRKIKNENTPEIDFDSIEENLEEADLESFIRQAEETGQYAQALRLQYLALLQHLAEAGLIRWKKGKTNHDYERELLAAGLAGTFRELTAIFERIWYGEAILRADSYRRLAPRFREAIATLSPFAHIGQPPAPNYEE